MLSKRELDRDYIVLPLEGLWSAADPTACVGGDKDKWWWTMMIRQPEWIDAAMFSRPRDGAQAKQLPALPLRQVA